MNRNEMRYFSAKELSLYDVTSLPIGYLLKSLFIKMRRSTWGRMRDRRSRLVWTQTAVSDAVGPADNIRNYTDRRTIRSILADVKAKYPMRSACEVGCGYGRVTMVLAEFAEKVTGFEREAHLVGMASRLLPAIDFRRVESLDRLSSPEGAQFDLAMICTVLQHLTDNFCGNVLNEMKRVTPGGHILLIEKTESIGVTENKRDDMSFISRSRSVEEYSKLMHPFKLVSVTRRTVEPGYHNSHPGSCMLFRSPLLDNVK